MKDLKEVTGRTNLIEYEMPSFAEFISIDWMQNMVAYYVARKVNWKMERYARRQKRKDLLSAISNIK